MLQAKIFLIENSFAMLKAKIFLIETLLSMSKGFLDHNLFLDPNVTTIHRDYPDNRAKDVQISILCPVLVPSPQSLVPSPKSIGPKSLVLRFLVPTLIQNLSILLCLEALEKFLVGWGGGLDQF